MRTYIINQRRYDLGSMECLWKGRQEISTGIFVLGVYVTPRSRKVVVVSESIWGDGRGRIEGDHAYIASPTDIAFYADKLGITELYEFFPDGD